MMLSTVLLAIIIPTSVLASTGTVSGRPTSSSAVNPPYPYSNTTFSYHPTGTGSSFNFPYTTTTSTFGTGTGPIVTVVSTETTTSTTTVTYGAFGKRLIRGLNDKVYYPISYSTSTSNVDPTTTSNGSSAGTAHSTSTTHPTGTGHPTGYPTSYPTGTSGGPLPTGTYGLARYVRRNIL